MNGKDTHPGFSPALALGLALTIVLDTATQLLWKVAVLGLPGDASLQATIAAVFRQPWFAVIVALFLVQLVNWLKVLKHADLSFAQPITSLSYLTVSGASWWFLGEPIGPLKSCGILLILAGVWLTSQGPSKTRSTARLSP